MEANQVEELNSLLIIIAVAISTLAWIFNDSVEASLGLKPLQALRRASLSVNENNARGVQPAKDPMRVPVTLYMTLVSTSAWKHFGTNPIYVLTSLLLRLYLVGEMWTRNMPRIFRYIFEFGIRTNYFEPFILLLGLLGFAESNNIYDLSIMLLCPWGFVSLNPDTPIAALVTWSAATSYILITRITTDVIYISVIQVSRLMNQLN